MENNINNENIYKGSGIYGLINPYQNELIYVGQAKNIHKRYLQHCSISNNIGNSKIKSFLYETIKDKKLPKLVILEKTINLDDREMYWIKYYRNLGIDLANMNDGGKSMIHTSRAKKNKPWGNSWSPLQRIFINYRDAIKTLKKIGKDTSELELKFLKIQELINNFGRDYFNDKLYKKYGK